jgi:hypothetical protein
MFELSEDLVVKMSSELVGALVIVVGIVSEDISFVNLQEVLAENDHVLPLGVTPKFVRSPVNGAFESSALRHPDLVHPWLHFRRFLTAREQPATGDTLVGNVAVE